VQPDLSELMQHAVSPEARSAIAHALQAWIQPGLQGPRVDAWGVFDGRNTEAVLSLVAALGQSGALVVAEHDDVRVLLVRAGILVGVSSTVLFEQLGRILYQAERIEHDDSSLLIETAEREGDAALLRLLPQATLSWALDRRARDVTAMLFSVRRGFYAWVEGDPHMHGLPSLALELPALARRALAIHEAWRQGTQSSQEADASGPAPEQAEGAADPGETTPARKEAVDDLFRKIREAKLGPR
jgi:hypothetical protein